MFKAAAVPASASVPASSPTDSVLHTGLLAEYVQSVLARHSTQVLSVAHTAFGAEQLVFLVQATQTLPGILQAGLATGQFVSFVQATQVLVEVSQAGVAPLQCESSVQPTQT